MADTLIKHKQSVQSLSDRTKPKHNCVGLRVSYLVLQSWHTLCKLKSSNKMWSEGEMEIVPILSGNILVFRCRFLDATFTIYNYVGFESKIKVEEL